MQDIIALFTESQVPWMMLSIVLIVFIIRLQNDKMLALCESMSRLTSLYEQHDKQAAAIHQETEFIKEWCISRVGDTNCRPRD